MNKSFKWYLLNIRDLVEAKVKLYQGSNLANVENIFDEVVGSIDSF
jgi:hypothetical protein